MEIIIHYDVDFKVNHVRTLSYTVKKKTSNSWISYLCTYVIKTKSFEMSKVSVFDYIVRAIAEVLK